MHNYIRCVGSLCSRMIQTQLPRVETPRSLAYQPPLDGQLQPASAILMNFAPVEIVPWRLIPPNVVIHWPSQTNGHSHKPSKSPVVQNPAKRTFAIFPLIVPVFQEPTNFPIASEVAAPVLRPCIRTRSQSRSFWVDFKDNVPSSINRGDAGSCVNFVYWSQLGPRKAKSLTRKSWTLYLLRSGLPISETRILFWRGPLFGHRGGQNASALNLYGF